MSPKRAGVRLGVIGLAVAVLTFVAVQEASARVKVGVLTCRVSAGMGFVLGSSKRVNCTFEPSAGARERYTGRISRLGVDVGFTTAGVIVWAVFAPESGYSRHALAGHYGGASAEASLVAGLGANVLVGGSRRSFALQPLSVQGQVGVSVAAGIAGLDLYAAR